MSLVDLVMPKLGESIMEATILKWHKQPGDSVKEDETVLDIATDKVDSEVPSTSAGTIESILFNENDVVPIGTVIAKIRLGANAAVTQSTASTPAPEPDYEEAKLVEEVPYQPSAFTPVPGANPAPSNGLRFYSPLVLNIAQQEGISMSDLEKIPGTGQDGRVSKKDMLQYIEQRQQQPVQSAQPTTSATIVQPQTQVKNNDVAVAPTNNQPAVQTYSGNVEVIEMDRMRKLIAKHMVDSKHTSAHVTSFAECDVTNLVLWREKIKKDFEKRENEKDHLHAAVY